MEYLYDPHTHTKEVSRCGWMPAQEVVSLYHARGYTGIAVTDHLHEGYIFSLACRDDWQACVSVYMSGYHRSRQKALDYGMDVIFGAEIRFPENDRDYLIYGIDEDFLRRNPYLHRLGHQAFYEKFKDPDCPNKEVVKRMKALSEQYTKKKFFIFNGFPDIAVLTSLSSLLSKDTL